MFLQKAEQILGVTLTAVLLAVSILLLVGVVSGCSRDKQELLKYRFTCPQGNEVRLYITMEEYQNQTGLYDRVIKECNNVTSDPKLLAGEQENN